MTMIGSYQADVGSHVAIIIPFYNGSRYIKQALDSVYFQSTKFHEVVVVNDGSAFDESNYVTDLSKEYGFLLINKDNGGQGSARNAGVAATQSDYICFLDQDDMLLPHHAQTLLDGIAILPEPKGWTYGEFSTSDAEGNIMRQGWFDFLGQHPKRDFYECISENMFVLPSATIVSREAFLSVGGFDEQFTGYEDDDLFLRLFRAGYTNNYISCPLYVWRSHEGQTSSSLRMCRSRLCFIEKWAGLKIDSSYDNKLFYHGLYYRFFEVVLRDYCFAKSEQEQAELKKIFHDFLLLFNDMLLGKTRLMNRMLLALFPHVPRFFWIQAVRLKIPLRFFFRFIKR